MKRITITITDTPDGRSALVTTDAERPQVGRKLTPAEALAVDLLRACIHEAARVEFDPQAVPLVSLALELLDPVNAHLVPREFRARAIGALGRTPEGHPVFTGVDIDAVHAVHARHPAHHT